MRQLSGPFGLRGPGHRHRFPQRQDAVRRRVAVPAVPERLDRGLDDMRRGWEIRLADPEIDDIAAAGGECGGPGQNRK